jgi:poly(A) polymerase
MEFKTDFEIYKPELSDIYSTHSLRSLISIIKSYSRGADIRLVGGCVRDGLLNTPSHDIDLATNLEPEQVIKQLSDNHIKVIDTGSKFGTVTAIIDKIPYEITTLRKDIECYGRRAKVEYTSSFFEDACRRDFTINAMSYDPESGKLYDYFYGTEHLLSKQVVFIGKPQDRIREDYLRILRFFRFTGRFAEQLDVSGFEACKNLRTGLLELSRERVNEEFVKILEVENYFYILEKMQEVSILELILPELPIELTRLEYLDSLSPPATLAEPQNFDAKIKMALLIFDPKIKNYSQILKNLKFSNKFISVINELHETGRYSNSHILLRLKQLKYKSRNYSKHLVFWTALNEQSYEYIITLAEQIEQFRPEALPVDGNKLAAMGYRGAEIGEKLKELEEKWLENNCAISTEKLLESLK